MADAATNPTETITIDPAAAARRRVFTAAWLAIGIALVVETLLVLLRQRASTAAAFSDFASKVSWSVVVCAALAVARSAGSGLMGIVGLFASPIALTLAKVVHKSAHQVLGLPPTTAIPPWGILVVKALEYAVLGFIVEKMLRAGRGMKAHTGAGLAVGAVFGGTVIGMQAPADALAAAAAGVNEVIFPVGCSLTLYAADRVAKRKSAT